jgi:hypothetical protein
MAGCEGETEAVPEALPEAGDRTAPEAAPELAPEAYLVGEVGAETGEMTFTEGAKDGKHYWLTPPDLMAALNSEFKFNFDPCPYPKPEGFDGLQVEWGKCNYVNPPFGVTIHNGKKKGATAWARKAIIEFQKGKKVVLVYPIDKWILMLLEAGAEVRNLHDVKWCATEDGLPGKGTGRWIAEFILDPDKSHAQEE